MGNAADLGRRWIADALVNVDTWEEPTYEAVLAVFPYPPERNIPEDAWLALVSHASLARGTDPLREAERLASYVSVYRERHGLTLHPKTLLPEAITVQENNA